MDVPRSRHSGTPAIRVQRYFRRQHLAAVDRLLRDLEVAGRPWRYRLLRTTACRPLGAFGSPARRVPSVLHRVHPPLSHHGGQEDSQVVDLLGGVRSGAFGKERCQKEKCVVTACCAQRPRRRQRIDQTALRFWRLSLEPLPRILDRHRSAGLSNHHPIVKNLQARPEDDSSSCNHGNRSRSSATRNIALTRPSCLRR